MFDVTKAVHGGKGVLYIYGNYSGDVMNFDMAAEMAELEGIRVETVVGKDDVASMPKNMKEDRRGVAGIYFLYKLASAKAAQGHSLNEVKSFAEKVNNRIKTIGVALSPCILPTVGKPNFNLGDNEMEIGMGIHGEPGIERGTIESANEIAVKLVDRLLEDFDEQPKIVSVLVNGLGATPYEELYIMYREVHHYLNEKGIKICKSFVGEYATSLEMTGLSVSILDTDVEMRSLLNE